MSWLTTYVAVSLIIGAAMELHEGDPWAPTPERAGGSRE